MSASSPGVTIFQAPGAGSHLFPRVLYDLEFPALEALLEGWGETSPATRRSYARAIWKELYRLCVTDFDHMTTLPQALRRWLANETTFYVPPVLTRLETPDGETRKDLLQLEDGERIEVVLLRYGERWSGCISTQIGCACGCRFCATGQMKFVRQLSGAEIVAQVLHLQRELAARRERLSNVVLMGMGEPLLNYDHTLAAIRRLIDPRAVAFIQRRITLSTVGIAPAIRRLADETGYRHGPMLINLAVSLHAATDALRNQLVPINRRYPLDDLFAAVRVYAARTQRRVMFEWVLIDGVNDAPEQAEALVERLAEIDAHVNLIRLNPTLGYAGRASSPPAIEAFTAVLDRANVPHTMRQRRGEEIAAGCGQLRCSHPVWE